MESPSIGSLTDDILLRIFSRSIEQPAPRESHLDSFTTDVRPVVMAVPAPPPASDVARNLLIASVCRRWRRIAKLHVTTVSVKENLLVSREDLSAAVTCFPNLTHLHISDNSVETLDNAFLAHLASTCPKLVSLHVGRSFVRQAPSSHGLVKHYHRMERPITTEGLDRFFQKLLNLEHITLACLHQGTEVPDSVFQLRRLHTLLLTDASVLENSSFTSLTALTTLYISFSTSNQQLSTLLPRLVHPSTVAPHSHQLMGAASMTLPSSLKSLNLSMSSPVLRTVFSSASPFTALEELLIIECSELETFPDCIGDLLPCLRNLTIRKCYYFSHLLEGFTSLTRLETLIVANSDSFTLPSNFGHLPTLKLLALEGLRFTEFPPSFCHLMSLEALSIVDCNELLQLRAGFCRLTALKALCLSSLRGLTLRENVGALASLEAFRLHISRNTASFTQLSSLTSLELEQYGVNELPQALGEISRLRELKIIDCSITTLPSSLTRLMRLQALEVRGCSSLSEVPSRLDMLVGLQRLELTACPQLTSPPNGLPNSLRTLCLGFFMQGSSHLVDISHLSQLRVLKLNCVGVICGPAGSSRLSCLQQLEQLEMRLDRGSQELPVPLTLMFLPRLRSLLIEAPGMCNLSGNLGAALPQLRQLTLFLRSSEELPGSIAELNSLTSLRVNAPLLTSLPQGMSRLSRLRKLELIHCHSLQHLPESLTQLHQLILQYTPISSLPAGLRLI